MSLLKPNRPLENLSGKCVEGKSYDILPFSDELTVPDGLVVCKLRLTSFHQSE